MCIIQWPDFPIDTGNHAGKIRHSRLFGEITHSCSGRETELLAGIPKNHQVVLKHLTPEVFEKFCVGRRPFMIQLQTPQPV